MCNSSNKYGISKKNSGIFKKNRIINKIKSGTGPEYLKIFNNFIAFYLLQIYTYY